MVQDDEWGKGIVARLREHGQALGFSQIGVAGVDMSSAEPGLQAWLDAGFHGGMDYMARHGLLRARPAELVEGTLSVITARMDYLPMSTPDGWQAVEWQGLADPDRAMVSVYARGRDYHKVLRQRLRQLAEWLAEQVGPVGYRVFTDSAPVMEVELASRSGLGWRGKHTLNLSRDGGSMHFLGEIFINMALPETEAASAHCGSCEACITICPTGAIVGPYRLDARRCISYLTIEHAGPIPVSLRHLIGNRIYGCDDCQLACPWNKYAQRSNLLDFEPRGHGTGASLLGLWAWTEADFLRNTEGSSIRRIGHQRWQRNLAVGMGNALAAATVDAPAIILALRLALPAATPLVAEHISWALAQTVPE